MLCALVLACGEDNPTEPVPGIVGNWRLQVFELPSTSADNLLSNFRAQGVTEADATESVNEMRQMLEEATRESGWGIVRFNADGTWVDNEGGKGTYSVSGGQLTINEPGEPTWTAQHFVTDTVLTITISGSELLKLGEDLGTTPEEQRAVEHLLQGVDIRMVLQRA